MHVFSSSSLINSKTRDSLFLLSALHTIGQGVNIVIHRRTISQIFCLPVISDTVSVYLAAALEKKCEPDTKASVHLRNRKLMIHELTGLDDNHPIQCSMYGKIKHNGRDGYHVTTCPVSQPLVYTFCHHPLAPSSSIHKYTGEEERVASFI
jgi:hypothetical protein